MGDADIIAPGQYSSSRQQIIFGAFLWLSERLLKLFVIVAILPRTAEVHLFTVHLLALKTYRERSIGLEQI
jgi:hypothetical protein